MYQPKSDSLLGNGLIEVHHTRAIADYEDGATTELTDLILVCSNCHYVIHRDRHYERNYRQLQEVVALLRSTQATRNKKKGQQGGTDNDGAAPRRV
jgi:hypothetical protein